MNVAQDVLLHKSLTLPSAGIPECTNAYDFLLQLFGSRQRVERVSEDIRVILSLHGTSVEQDAYAGFVDKPGNESASRLWSTLGQCCARIAADDSKLEDLQKIQEILSHLSSSYARSTYVTPPELASAVELVKVALARRRLGRQITTQLTYQGRIGWYLAYAMDSRGELIAAIFKNSECRSSWMKMDQQPRRDLPPAFDESVPLAADTRSACDSVDSKETDWTDLLIAEETLRHARVCREEPQSNTSVTSESELEPVDGELRDDFLANGEDMNPPAADDVIRDVMPKPVADIEPNIPAGDANPGTSLDQGESDGWVYVEETPDDGEIVAPHNDREEGPEWEDAGGSDGEVLDSPKSELENREVAATLSEVDDVVCEPVKDVVDLGTDLEQPEDEILSEVKKIPDGQTIVLPEDSRPGIGFTGALGEGYSGEIPTLEHVEKFDELSPEELGGAEEAHVHPLMEAPSEVPEGSDMDLSTDDGVIVMPADSPDSQSGDGDTQPLPGEDSQPLHEHVETELVIPGKKRWNAPLLVETAVAGAVAFAARNPTVAAMVVAGAVIYPIAKSAVNLTASLFAGDRKTNEQIGDIFTQVMRRGHCVLERKGSWFSNASTVVMRPDIPWSEVVKSKTSRAFDERDSAKVLSTLRSRMSVIDVYKVLGTREYSNATFYVVQPDPDMSWPDFDGVEKALLDEQRWQSDGDEKVCELVNDELFALLNACGSTGVLWQCIDRIRISFTNGKVQLRCDKTTFEKLFSGNKA
ncbi:MAG: hypothetical protein LBF26_02015 [Puniceicoccales bacterium]|nr:hypothetical protein [Puniceicoccales bacterium]